MRLYAAKKSQRILSECTLTLIIWKTIYSTLDGGLLQIRRNGFNILRHCGLVGSAPAWDGTGCEFDSWQCRIYIPCSLSLRLLGSLRGSLGTYGLTQKLCLKKTYSDIFPSQDCFYNKLLQLLFNFMFIM